MISTPMGRLPRHHRHLPPNERAIFLRKSRSGLPTTLASFRSAPFSLRWRYCLSAREYLRGRRSDSIGVPVHSLENTRFDTSAEPIRGFFVWDQKNPSLRPQSSPMAQSNDMPPPGTDYGGMFAWNGSVLNGCDPSHHMPAPLDEDSLWHDLLHFFYLNPMEPGSGGACLPLGGPELLLSPTFPGPNPYPSYQWGGDSLGVSTPDLWTSSGNGTNPYHFPGGNESAPPPLCPSQSPARSTTTAQPTEYGGNGAIHEGNARQRMPKRTQSLPTRVGHVRPEPYKVPERRNTDSDTVIYCDECPKGAQAKFTGIYARTNLSRHKTSKHRAKKDLICEVCRIPLGRSDAKLVHERNIHGIDKCSTTAVPDISSSPDSQDTSISASS
ncbi:hypothetical protein BCR34DRAFT_138783 [Clohesyomyces aquaticus]|uniref:C2H2-type domain-containing protein n=1 Tax=Clohesyomyces aquaticus TaxID=1231657 RepID=A0A1Y2A0X7_9PLEO|nr:hypothetical protein BCR34DRAFT_138783 [Clohesyomyces aquaticus]